MKNQKGISLITLLFIIIVIVIVIFLIISQTNEPDAETNEPDVVGKSTTDYDYLLKNKPSSAQIESATTIDYRTLYKGANTLNGNFYNITGEIVQVVEDRIYHVNMTENSSDYSSYSYYTDRIQISVIGTPSEILMEGDIISFTGESLGNYTYTSVMGSSNTIPFLRVYAENLKVIGHTD